MHVKEWKSVLFVNIFSNFMETVTEEAYLKQLAIEEWYGKKQAEKAKAEKEEL